MILCVDTETWISYHCVSPTAQHLDVIPSFPQIITMDVPSARRGNAVTHRLPTLNPVPLVLIEEHHEAFYIWRYAARAGWMPECGNVLLQDRKSVV